MLFYRFETNLCDHGVSIHLDEYKLVKETRLGYWIVSTWISTDKHWVSKTARKRYAYPTVEEALCSFKCRKQRQIKILANQLNNAREALLQANNDSWHNQTTTLRAAAQQTKQTTNNNEIHSNNSNQQHQQR